MRPEIFSRTIRVLLKNTRRTFSFGGFVFSCFLFFILSTHTAHANNCQSNGTGGGSWGTAGTWTSCGGTTPQAADNVTILSGDTVTMNGNSGACTNLTISGVANWGQARTTNVSGNLTLSGGTLSGSSTGVLNVTGTFTVSASTTNSIQRVTITVTSTTAVDGTLNLETSATGTKTFVGLVTVGSNGTWNNSINEAVTFRGGITNNGTFTAGTGIQTFNTNAQAVSGNSFTIPNATVTTITLTNNITASGGFVVSTALSGTGGLTQGTSAVLKLGGTSGITTMTATANPNTVEYNGTGTQTIKAITYHHLTINDSGTTASNTGTVTTNGNLTISSGTFNMSTGTITVNGVTNVNGGTLDDSSTTGTDTFVGLVTVGASGAWTSTGNESYSFRGGLTNNGSLTSGTGVYTFDTNSQAIGGNSTTIGNATVTTVTLTNNITASGGFVVSTALSGTGGLTQGTSAVLKLGGTSGITTMTATANPNTVEYNGTTQTVHSNTYYHLTLSGGGAKTLQTGTTAVSGDLTLSTTNTTATTVVGLTISGALTIGSGTTFTAAGFSLDVTGTTSVTGTFTISSATGAKTFANITINNGGTWNNTAGNEALSISGNIQNDGTFNAGNGTHTLTGTTKTLSGANELTIPSVAISGSYTNNGTLTIATALTGAGSLAQGTNSTLNIAASDANFTITTLTANANGNTVNYNSTGAQTIKAINYHHLTLSGNRTTNSITLASSGTIGIAGTFSPTATFTSGAYITTGSTLDFNGSGSQTIPSFNYNNLTSSSTGTRTLTSAPANWYDTSWMYRKKVTFGNNFSGAGTLTNFPVMVAIDSSRIDYGNTQNSGQDLRFTDSDGTTLLSYEIEKWDESGTSIAWVKVPQIDNSATDYIYMYYGNPSATDSQNKTAVWNGNEVDVWHLGEGSGGSAGDSTSSGNTGTLTGSTWTTSGQVDGALSFNGTSSDYVQFASNVDITGTKAVSFWFKPTGNITNDHTMFYASDGTANDYLAIEIFSSRVAAITDDTFNATRNRNTSVTISANNWYYLTVNKGTLSISNIYLNGTDVVQDDGNFIGGGTAATFIGGDTASYFPGVMDEVRVYSGTRSAAEVGADYRGMSDTFNTYGSQENAASPIGIAAVFTPGSNSYTVTGSTVDFNGSGSQTIPAFSYNNLTSSSSGGRTLASSGTISIAGTFTPGSNSYTVTGSTMNFNGSSAQTVNASFTYNHLQVKPSANTITTNFAAGTVTVNGDLTIGNGTNTSVVVNANNASTTLTVLGSVSISTNTTLQANASNNFTISDDFTNNGTFTHNNGTVVFNDNTKTSSLNYSADTTFYNLSVTTSGKAMQFDEAQKTTVTHTLTITGADCTTGRIFLDSVVDNNQWDMTVTGATVSISYTDVEDANAVTTAITTSNSTANNDNNTNWTINGGACGGNTNPNVPASLTQKNSSDVTISESAWTNSNTPKLGFIITDPDTDTVKYEVQVATDSGFSSLVLDYTHGSLSASGTTFTFVVGTYTGGTCTGTCPSTLSDSSGGYWWRVKAIDSNSAESAYVEPGVAGTVDFKVDATAPTGGSAYDGTSGDQDWNDGSLTSISGNWTGIDATVSGVQKYEYAIRRKPDDYYWSVCSGSGSWQAGALWCDNATSTSFAQNTLNLATGVTYYISVRTTDNAGNVGTAINSNGQQVLPMLSFSLSGNTVAFSNLNAANSYTDTKTITTTTSTNAANGYTIKVYNTDFLRASPSITIPDFSGTWSSPATWSGGQYGFGYTSDDTSVQGSNRFSGGTAFAAFSQSPPGDVVADHTTAIDGSTGSVSSEHFTITYKVAASTSQDALYYQTSSIFIVTANY